MRERIAYLERQVEEEREARRRADTLLARLMDRVPELEAPAEAPPDERGSSEGAEPGRGGIAPARCTWPAGTRTAAPVVAQGVQADDAALIIDLISLLIGGTTLAVVLYQLYESKRRVEIDFSVEPLHVAPWPGPMPAAIFWVTNLGKTRRGFTGCWYDIARGKRLVQFDSHSSEGLRIGSSSTDSPQDIGAHNVLSEPSGARRFR